MGTAAAPAELCGATTAESLANTHVPTKVVTYCPNLTISLNTNRFDSSLNALGPQGIDVARSEALRALSRAAEAGADAGDAYLMAELLVVMLQVARGEQLDLLARAGEIEKRAQDIGFVSFYWFDILRAVIAQLDATPERDKLETTRARLLVMLGPEGQIALARRTSRPPAL